MRVSHRPPGIAKALSVSDQGRHGAWSQEMDGWILQCYTWGPEGYQECEWDLCRALSFSISGGFQV